MITVFVFIFLESVRIRFEAGYVGVALDKSLHPNDRVFDFTTAPGFLSAAQYAVLIFFFLWNLPRLCLQALRRCKAGALIVLALCCNSFCMPKLGCSRPMCECKVLLDNTNDKLHGLALSLAQE